MEGPQEAEVLLSLRDHWEQLLGQEGTAGTHGHHLPEHLREWTLGPRHHFQP